MREILQFFYENPLLVLILVGWLFSALAGAAGKAAKRAAQSPPRQRPHFDALREQQRRQAQQAEAAKTAPRAAPTPEDIARELRQMLGLEGPRRPPPRDEAEAARAEAPAEETPRYREPEVGDEVLPRVPTLAVADREELRRKRVTHPLLTRPPEQHVGGRPVHHFAAPQARRQRRVFDRQRAIAAVIGMEVLGPPRALRPYGGPEAAQEQPQA